MRILLLVHRFNSLSQRLYVELQRDGHELSVEFDIHDDVTREAVELFRPDLVLAPFLKRAIPASVWQRLPCLIVHPGPPGDRGPAALDWAILRGTDKWGVTVLQAQAAMDAGPVWASEEFTMRTARKSSLYRNEVAEAAVSAVRRAIARLNAGERPAAPGAGAHGWQPPLAQPRRALDWQRDDTATVLRKLHAADGFPGVEDVLLERRFRLFDGHREERLAGRPGTLIARRHGAICRATRDGAVWIGQLQPVEDGQRGFKRPAAVALGPLAQDLPVSEDDPAAPRNDASLREIRYEERGSIGYLHFDFYNGAMSTAQCKRLRTAYAQARRRPTRIIVLMGGEDFWSNGMHLHCIEAAESPADASWDNINAIDDLAQDILTTDTHLTIAALQGNAAAGGVFLALAADLVLARSGVVLNPHYRNMGNLYGSEYWTYLLPRRTGGERAQTLLGATGTGKTMTMAATIQAVQRPSLVIAHNKTLAAQLCNEFRTYFPSNAVEYFVSYYDYYQPEAYVPSKDLYIEKDSAINQEIDRLRHAATAGLFARRDVVIVASVSCIFGLGSPATYDENLQTLNKGEMIDRDKLLRKLVSIQYTRNDTALGRGTFRVRGETLEIFPAYAETAYRIVLFGDEVEHLQHFDPVTGELIEDDLEHVAIWPASHYNVREGMIDDAVADIGSELNQRCAELEAAGKLLESHRLRQRKAGATTATRVCVPGRCRDVVLGRPSHHRRLVGNRLRADRLVADRACRRARRFPRHAGRGGRDGRPRPPYAARPEHGRAVRPCGNLEPQFPGRGQPRHRAL